MANEPAQNATEKQAPGKMRCFTFGDPEPVLESNVQDYLGCFLSGAFPYYEPPVPLKMMYKTFRANAHHGTIPYFICNMVLMYYVNNQLLPRSEFKKIVHEYLRYGNAYVQTVYNVFGKLIALRHLPALSMRRMKDPGTFCMLNLWGQIVAKYTQGEVIHIKEYDSVQEIYGLPQWLGGLQALLLNEDATLFRRKYFRNGAHMGYIFFTNDAQLSDDDADELQEQIEASKGAGNFKSMFIHAPGADKDAVKLIPVGDFSTKDQHEALKNITMGEIISVWRVPPSMANVISSATGGFGDPRKIAEVYLVNEVIPWQQAFDAINDAINGPPVVVFDNPITSLTTITDTQTAPTTTARNGA
jgi:PBSX family phage portal protein